MSFNSQSLASCTVGGPATTTGRDHFWQTIGADLLGAFVARNSIVVSPEIQRFRRFFRRLGAPSALAA
jgi:hypothetical protein